MVTRSRHLDQLTERQREVLALVSRGLTNGQIATHLGISLDGAKWHVSEIISRLGVSSREEAAAIWRYEQRPVVRMRRWVGSLAIKPVAAAAAGSLVVVAGVAVAVALAMQSGNDAPPSGNETPPAADTPTVDDAGTPEPALTASPGTLLQLPTEPQLRDPDGTAELEERPQSAFPEHDPNAVILYDTQTNQARELGPGYRPVFSGDGRWMAWVSMDERLLVVEVPDGAVRDLGASDRVMWLDGSAVLVQDPSTRELYRVDLESGNRALSDIQEPSKEGYPAASVAVEPPRVRDGLRIVGDRRERIVDASGATIIEFGQQPVAPSPVWVDDGSVIVVIPSDTDSLANIFILDVYSGEAEFLATAEAGRHEYGGLLPVPVAANDRYVVWTDNFCGITQDGRPAAKTMVYDRANEKLVSLTEILFPAWITDDDRLGIGSFGATAVIDLRTLQYDVVLPDSFDVVWTPDVRFAARGLVGGHGGYCPP